MAPRLIHLFFAQLAVLARTGNCFVAPSNNYVDGACAIDFSTDAVQSDLFPEKWKVSPEYSLRWNVTYHGSYKVLRNTWSSRVWILYQCGTIPPEVTANETLVAVPIQSAATTSTTYLPFFEMIGERLSVKVYTSDFEYVSSACLRKLYRNGEIVQAYDPATWSINMSLIDVDMTFTDPFTAASVPEPKYIMTDTLEDSVLKTVEYVQVIGLFFNREKAATEAIDAIVERYTCVRDEVVAMVADRRTQRVLYTNYWQAADGWNVASCPNWYCEVIEAAGGEVVLGTEPEVEYFGWFWYSTDQINDLIARSDVVISDGIWPEDVAIVPADVEVFDNQGKLGPYDWYERRHVEPDVFLQDLVEAFWPDDFDYERKFLRKVGVEAAGSRPEDVDAACPDVHEPYVFQGAVCGGQQNKKDNKKSASNAKWLLPLCVAVGVVALCVAAFALCYNYPLSRDSEKFEAVKATPPVKDESP